MKFYVSVCTHTGKLDYIVWGNGLEFHLEERSIRSNAVPMNAIEDLEELLQEDLVDDWKYITEGCHRIYNYDLETHDLELEAESK